MLKCILGLQYRTHTQMTFSRVPPKETWARVADGHRSSDLLFGLGGSGSCGGGNEG